MAFYDKFPYTNFQELNLDRIAERIEDIDNSVKEAAESEANAKASETAAKASENAAKASEEAAGASADYAETSREIISQQLQEIPDIENQIAVERARIDSLASLTEGSTTGDAELQDIRVGYDGYTWPSAGDAVRGQIGQLEDQIETLGDNLFNVYMMDRKTSDTHPYGLSQGYYQGEVGEVYTTNNSNRFGKYHFAVSVDNYPELASAKTIKFTPHPDYGVQIIEVTSDNIIVSKTSPTVNTVTNPDLKGKAWTIEFNPERKYLVNIGRFVDGTTPETFAGVTQSFADQYTMEVQELKNKARTGDYEWFSVNVERPLPFGGSETNTETVSVECVLRLPTSYSINGAPVRLVLACHGETGYIEKSTETWYNNAWKSLMDELVSAGYAVFDCNCLPNSYSTAVRGRNMGGPLFLQTARRAYDYIQRYYNVLPEILVHGTSMGGTAAEAFANAYPQLVLAISSFAGRDLTQYIYELAQGDLDNDNNMAVAWGYANIAGLKSDFWSHIEGMAPSLSLVRLTNGVIDYQPDRASAFNAWMAYYGEIQSHTEGSTIGQYMAHRDVPYKTWESWDDNEMKTEAKLYLKKAFDHGSSVPYEVVIYEGYDHSEMSYGEVENMRNQLLAWFKRWE